MPNRSNTGNASLVEGALLLLEYLLKAKRQRSVPDIDLLKSDCAPDLPHPFEGCFSFLQYFGYLKCNQRSGQVNITLDGQRVLKSIDTGVLQAKVAQYLGTVASPPGPAATIAPEKRPRRSPRKRPPRSRQRLTPVIERADLQPGRTEDLQLEQPKGPQPGEPEDLQPGEPEDLQPEQPEDLQPEQPEDLQPEQPEDLQPEQPMDFLEGRYIMERILGAGNIGTVYLARQVSLDRPVALKVVDKLIQFFPQPDFFGVLQRFAGEMDLAGALLHANIVEVLDSDMHKKIPYVVSEYLPSGSLRQVLQSSTAITPVLAQKIFLQCLHALRHAHESNVLHLHLKPENILLDHGNNAKISDFGMARLLQESRAMELLGNASSFVYIAPELVTDPLGGNPRCDLYSLGLIFYELLAGQLPTRRCPMPRELHPGLPTVMDQIFDRLTQDDPDDRYDSAHEVLEDFYYHAG